MTEEVSYALKKINNAFAKLKEGVAEAKSELQRDGVIQRFEFTFEAFWKAIRVILRDKGIETKTPKESLQEAFRIGWIDNEEIFLDMLEDRNKTSHIYDKDTATEIFQRIKDNYLTAIGKVIDKLEKSS